MVPDEKPIPKSKTTARSSSRTSKKLKVEQGPPGKENLEMESSSQSGPLSQSKLEEEERQMVTAVKKGAAIVDPKCPIADRVHVYSQGKDVYGMTFFWCH
jgi:hypothetical protein